jgi:hypothetical protein
VGVIRIVYEDRRVEKAFSDFSQMQKKYGQDLTKQIKTRYEHVKAASNFFEYAFVLRLGNPHSLDGEFVGCYGVSVTGKVRLILKPICDDLTPESLKLCDEVILKGVADYHGQKVEWIIP